MCQPDAAVVSGCPQCASRLANGPLLTSGFLTVRFSNFCFRMGAPTILFGDVSARTMRSPASSVSTQFDVQMPLQLTLTAGLFLFPVLLYFCISTAYNRIECTTPQKAALLLLDVRHYTLEVAGYLTCFCHCAAHVPSCAHVLFGASFSYAMALWSLFLGRIGGISTFF